MRASLVVVVTLATFALVQCQPDWKQKFKFVPLQESLIEGRPIRNFLPPRYENLFGQRSTKLRVASFAPSMSDITGKVNQQRRQLFSWQPSNSDIFRR
ncbi:unnamed protein product [Cylicocyclus nassatus]|uniref:Uncharacterized protein n=1 Tax=Cylicocyclus nassatus TaxID=53992 RepID=A0AA36DP83_CYLNA|nr:unnamed protein product [Cylicocyclus nassatus]